MSSSKESLYSYSIVRRHGGKRKKKAMHSTPVTDLHKTLSSVTISSIGTSSSRDEKKPRKKKKRFSKLLNTLELNKQDESSNDWETELIELLSPNVSPLLGKGKRKSLLPGSNGLFKSPEATRDAQHFVERLQKSPVLQTHKKQLFCFDEEDDCALEYVLPKTNTRSFQSNSPLFLREGLPSKVYPAPPKKSKNVKNSIDCQLVPHYQNEANNILWEAYIKKIFGDTSEYLRTREKMSKSSQSSSNQELSLNKKQNSNEEVLNIVKKGKSKFRSKAEIKEEVEIKIKEYWNKFTQQWIRVGLDTDIYEFRDESPTKQGIKHNEQISQKQKAQALSRIKPAIHKTYKKPTIRSIEELERFQCRRISDHQWELQIYSFKIKPNNL